MCNCLCCCNEDRSMVLIEDRCQACYISFFLLLEKSNTTNTGHTKIPSAMPMEKKTVWPIIMLTQMSLSRSRKRIQK